MPIEANQSVETDGTVTPANRPAEQLVRTRTGRPVPRTTIEIGLDREAEAGRARRERARRGLGYALGALGLTAFGAIIVFLASIGGDRARLQTVMQDFGHVVSVRKGIGINR